MTAASHPPSDPELLARYLRDGCERSFAALVDAHQRMVLGTALRRTGDAELARDVAQQVFALLARKAAWLAGRESLAGWLHRAASYLGSRAVRGEARARARHEALAQESGGMLRDAGEWSALDDALSALGAKDREALVLHYFEDRSYAEMAVTLGVSEAAARQRVSRGLRALGDRLRRRGIGASATALLASGAALQTTLPAQAGLAAAALSGSGVTSPAMLLFTTLMSHTPTKLAVSAIALTALPVVFLQETNARLIAERAAHAPLSLTADIAQMNASAPSPPPAGGGDVLAAWNELRAAQTNRQAAEQKLAALQRQLDQIQTEVVVSYGQVEDLAHRLAAKAREFEKFKHLNLEDKTDPTERDRLAQELATKMNDISDLFDVVREVQKLESDPEKAARFYAMMLGEMAALDEAAREPLLRVARDHFTEMKRNGLTAAARPRGDDSAWMESRCRAFAELDAALLRTLAPDRRLEAKKFGEIFDLTGRDFMPLGPAGEARK